MKSTNKIFNINLINLYQEETGDLIGIFNVDSRDELLEINITDKADIFIPSNVEIYISDLESQLMERDYEISATKNLKRVKFLTDDIRYDIKDYIDSVTPEYDDDYDKEERAERDFERFLNNL